MLPMFKKAHINTRVIEGFISKGILGDYDESTNKRNALKQAAGLYKMVDGELYRHGSDREYNKYGLRIVVHDDEPQKKLDIISKGHMDAAGNHFGMNNTIRNVNKLYYWHGMSSHVKMFLKKCEYCKERSRFTMEEWLEEEKKNLSKRKLKHESMSSEIKHEIKSLGRIRRSTPPETFFIVNAERKFDFETLNEGAEMLIDSNNIEYVVETLGSSDKGEELKEVCHVMNVPDIVALPERFRSREIEAFLKYGTFPADFTSNQKAGLKGPAVQYSIVEDELYHDCNKKNNSGLKLVIHDDNPALKVKVMVESHLDEDGNHFGLNRTMQRVAEKYFWLGLSLDVKKFMQHCKICSKNRGKRFEEDTSKFADEVKKLKAKQENHKGASYHDGDVQEIVTYTVGADGTDSTDQVIKLVGDDETQVTEITVKYIDGEIVHAVQQDGPQVVELSEEQIQALEQVTDTAEIVEHDVQEMDAESEMTGENKDHDGKSESQDGEQENDTENNLVIASVSSGQVENSGDNQDDPADDGDATENSVSVETAIKLLVDNEAHPKEVANTVTISNEPANYDSQSASSEYESYDMFYEGIVYIPRYKKTRAMEEYLRMGVVKTGFTTAKLRELTTNYFLLDDVLYRRPSRYKGKQVVLHDDQAKLKLNLIKEHHRKPNGTHCKELVTYMNMQYKFYWEELRWDVNRFFRNCPVCVRDGIEITTTKRVLTVEELQEKEIENRRRASELGTNANRNRAFREEHKNRLKTFTDWEKYGKFMSAEEIERKIKKEPGINDTPGYKKRKIEGGMGFEYVIDEDQIKFTDDNVELQEESDVEITLDDESSDEMEDTAVQQAEPESTVLTIYATRSQEEMIRKLYQERGWTYNLDSMTRCADQSQTEGTNDLYVMVMTTTPEQDNAIQVMFNSTVDGMTVEEVANEETNIKIENELNQIDEITVLPLESNSEAGQPQIEDVASPVNKAETVTEEMVQKVEQSKKEEDKNTDKMKKTTLKEDDDKFNKKNDGKETLKTKKTVTDKETKKTIDDKKTKKKEVNKEEPSKGTKRAAAAVDLNDSITESRRPRREIKRPRRFSPDRMEEEQKNMSPKKTPKTAEKSKPEPVKELNEIVDSTSDIETTPLRGRRRNKLASEPEVKISDKVTTPGAKKSVEIPDKSNDSKAVETPIGGTRTRSKRHVNNDEAEQQISSKKVTPAVNEAKSSPSVTQTRSNSRSSPRGKSNVVTDVSTSDEDNKKVKGRRTSRTRKDETVENMEIDFEQNGDIEADIGVISQEGVDEPENDDDVIGDDEDDGFTDDDDDHDDDGDEGDNSDDEAKDKQALAVLKIDKEYEMEIIYKDGMYMCSLCDAKFKTESECRIHGMQNKCYFTCELSGKVFKKNQQKEFEIHNAKYLSLKKEIKCPISKKCFVDQESLDVHLRLYAGLKNYKCTLTDEAFYTSFQLSSYLYRVHGIADQFTCDICSAKFGNIKFMRCEILFDGVLSYFKCVMCSK